MSVTTMEGSGANRRDAAAPIASADEVLAAVEDLAPAVAARAAEIEAGRRLPVDLVEQLRRAGCFRVLHPVSHGGIGADLTSAMRVFERLARADASVGWTVMIGAAAWCDLASLPRSTFDALFAAEPDMITAGAFNPTGSINAAGSGYRVAGRWGFASGCEHATWIYGNCVEGVVDGMPQLRAAVFAPDQIAIEDTWTVAGLCGTGSHHFHVDHVDVPAEWTFVPLADPPCIDEAIVRIPPPSLLSLLMGSVALGTAAGALDEIVAVAAEKVPMLSMAPLAAQPGFQLRLATADTDLRAARALLEEVASVAWSAAATGDAFSWNLRGEVRSAAVWVTGRAVSAIEAAYHAGGGSALYVSSPLQRRLRDIHALTQHFLLREDALTTAGAILAGQDVAVPVY